MILNGWSIALKNKYFIFRLQNVMNEIKLNKDKNLGKKKEKNYL